MTVNFILWINKKKKKSKVHLIFNFKSLNEKWFLEFESVARGQIFFEKMFLT